MNYYDWLASQYAYMYPDLYNRMIPLIEEELDRWEGRDWTPNQMDEFIDNVMERYNHLYPQTLQRPFGGQDTIRNLILIFLLSRLFRRGRLFRHGSYPNYPWSPRFPY